MPGQEENDPYLRPERIANFGLNIPMVFPSLPEIEKLKATLKPGASSLPIIPICVTGCKNSGKSFLLNIFHYFLKIQGKGNWLKNAAISNQVPSFPEHAEIPITAGIVIWPELIPFTDENTGKKFLVLIIDAEIRELEQDQELLEKVFLSFSSIVVSSHKGIFKKSLLESWTELDTFLQSSLTKRDMRSNGCDITLCKDVFFTIRDFGYDKNYPWGKEQKARAYIENEIKTTPHLQETFETIEENSSFFLLKQPTIDDAGNYDDKFLSQMETLAERIAEGISNSGRRYENLDDFFKHFKYACSFVSSYFTRRGLPISSQEKASNEVARTTEVDELAEQISKMNLSQDNGDVEHAESQTETTDPSLYELPEKYVGKKSSTQITGERPGPGCSYSLGKMRNTIGAPPFAAETGNENHENVGKSSLVGRPLVSSPEKVVPALTLSKRNKTDLEEDGSRSIKGNCKNLTEKCDSNTKTSVGSEEDEECRRAIFDDIVASYAEVKKLEFLAEAKIQLHISVVSEDDLTNLSEIRVKEFEAFLNNQGSSNNECVQTLRQTMKRELLQLLKKQRIDNAMHTKESATKGKLIPVQVKNVEPKKSGKCDEEVDRMEIDVVEYEPPKLYPSLEKMQIEDDEFEKKQSVKNVEKVMTQEAKEIFGKQLIISDDDFIAIFKKALQKTGVKSELFVFDANNSNHSQDFTLAELGNNECLHKMYDAVKRENEERKNGFHQFGEIFHQTFIKSLPAWVRQTSNSKEGICLQEEGFLVRVFESAVSNSNTIKFQHLYKKAVEDHPNFKNYANSLKNMKSTITKFKGTCEKKIEMNRCFSPEKLEQLFTTARQPWNEDCKWKKETECLIESEISRIETSFRELNKSIRENEIRIGESLIPIMVQFYHEIMKEKVKGKPLLPSRLAKIHTTFLEELQKRFSTCCAYKPNQGIDLSGKLREEINREFDTYTKSNKMLIGKIQSEVNLKKRTYRQQYNDEFSGHLPMEESGLSAKHKEASENSFKLFQIELKNIAWKYFPMDPLKLLKQEIADDWLEVQKDNASRLKRRREEEERRTLEEERERKRREALEEIKAQENSQRKEKASNSAIHSSSGKDQKPSTASENKCEVARKSPIPLKELPAIAIEFAYSYVKTGCMKNGKFEMINNKWGGSSTPTILRISHAASGKVAIGEEIISDPNTCFNIGEILQERDPSMTKGKHGCRPEFYIALFLSQLKVDVETQLGGRWTNVVITIPLSSTSVQRKVIKDSAHLAGFQTVTLLNDTTAAALAFAKTGPQYKGRTGCVLIGILGHNYYDAALYNYTKESIEMLSCWGNSHAHKKPSAGLRSKLKRGIEYLRSRVSGSFSTMEDLFKEMMGPEWSSVKDNFVIGYKKGCEISSAFDNFGQSWEDDDRLHVITGAAYYSESPTPICDIFPYVFRRQNQKQVDIFKASYKYKKEKQLISGADTLSTNSIAPSNQVIRVSEFSYVDSETPVNSYFAQVDSNDLKGRKGELKVEFSLTTDGIFGFENILLKEDKAKDWVSVSFVITSGNLDKEEFEEMRAMVSPFMWDEEKEAFKNAKNALVELQGAVALQLETRKISLLIKSLLQKEIDDVNVIISHSGTTREKLEKKAQLIQGLKDKFFR